MHLSTSISLSLSLYLSVSLCLTVLDVLPEDPELGVVLKRDEAALPGGADLHTNHHTDLHQPITTQTFTLTNQKRLSVFTLCILPR